VRTVEPLGLQRVAQHQRRARIEGTLGWFLAFVGAFTWYLGYVVIGAKLAVVVGGTLVFLAMQDLAWVEGYREALIDWDTTVLTDSLEDHRQRRQELLDALEDEALDDGPDDR
jgi:hypothetical protein